MTAARSLPRMAPFGTLDAAANDGGTTPGAAPGGFATGELGDQRPSPATVAAVLPAAFGLVGACERGAQILGRLTATWQNGSSYDGDLWLDILEYRELRMRSLAGATLDEQRSARLSALELRLQANDGGGARQFMRFFSRRVAQLSSAQAGPTDVMLVDISAGGAKLERLRPDCGSFFEGAEVALHVEEAGGPLGVVLPSRIVWARGTAFGIMFAGAARKGR